MLRGEFGLRFCLAVIAFDYAAFSVLWVVLVVGVSFSPFRSGFRHCEVSGWADDGLALLCCWRDDFMGEKKWLSSSAAGRGVNS